MITIDRARKLVERGVKALAPVSVNVKDACGYVVVCSVRARFDSPPFNRSSMDGFAFKASGVGSLKISQVVNAGRVPRPLAKGTCAKIMTGAMLPDGADTVIPKEQVTERNGRAYFKMSPKKGSFVRKKGGEFKKGEVLVEKGVTINSALLGLLSGQGIRKIKVFRRPSVGLLVTGDELGHGESLKRGKIFDSNGVIISSLLKEAGFKVVNLGIAKDSAGSLRRKIERGLKHDVLLVCGGVSVGERDLVKDILKSFGVKKVFWRVKQKPGKPLFFGNKGKRAIFGLPGNPAAVLVCTYEYVIPTLKKMMGRKEMWHKTSRVRLSGSIKWKRERVEFIRGLRAGDEVMPLFEHESSMLKKFSKANALIIARRNGHYRKGEMVDIHPL